MAFMAGIAWSQDAPRFILSPNPANQQVQISVQSGQTETLKVEFYTIIGNNVKTLQSVAEGGKLQINTSTLAEGVYLVRISSSGHTFTERLKIQHQ
jgi:extracellular elastinolytic metalloproteinase